VREEATDPTVIEALEWFVRMRDGNVSADDRRAFHAWLDHDPTHRAALLRAEALWKRFDIVKPEIERLRQTEKAVSRRNVILGGAVALIGGGALYLHSRSDLFADYVTDIGERRTVSLDDGSSIELGTYSALSVDFTAASRRIQLHRGQGFFEVAADSARPFSVEAAAGTMQALGTRFDVKYVDGLVTLVVNEHAVMVRGAFPAMTIEQGWQVSFGQKGAGVPVRADLTAAEAWRRDQIVFQDVPLRRVLAEIERYRRGRIVLMDGALGDIPVTAIFNGKQTENALRTLADTLPIRIFQAGSLLTVVYPA
jgi:transmembrane sensor